jgi:hypothetical protein
MVGCQCLVAEVCLIVLELLNFLIYVVHDLLEFIDAQQLI